MEHIRKRVLIIDDDEDMLFLLKETFEKNHFECVTAATSAEGLNKARTIKPNIILLDLLLPKMSGYGVLRELKRDPDLSKVPVVILTVLHDNEVAKGAMDLGASSYLTKSCKAEELISTIEQYSTA